MAFVLGLMLARSGKHGTRRPDGKVDLIFTNSFAVGAGAGGFWTTNTILNDGVKYTSIVDNSGGVVNSFS